jgi:Skp family chaperone for outer membrane proteins
MNLKLRTAAAALLAASFVGIYAYAGEPPAPAKKHAATKKPAKPTVEEQIESLRKEFQGQLDGLKTDLAAKDAALKQAQQQAADAQATAQKAEAAANMQQQANSDNASAVSTLQSTVTDLKANAVSVAATISDENLAIKKAINSPDVLHYKGITLSPAGSFIEGATVWRSAATGGGINTPLTSIPLEHADAAHMSEFYGEGRQSRIAIKAVGKLDKVTLTGYYEMDWLGTGITSNNNQSNSYAMRQRQIWAEAAFNSGLTLSGGQMWSLAAETTKGTSNGTEILPGTIDPQYTAGFVWARQYGFRVSQQLGKKLWIAASAENAETLNPSGSIVLNTGTTVLLGGSGVGGGLYNSTANYSYNLSPDFIVKVVAEPGWGHWEVFGIERNFRDRIYATGVDPRNDTEIGAGIGGSMRGTLAQKKLGIGLKGLWGQGVGRYGDSTLGDVTIKPDGTIAPLHGFSALASVDINPTPRLSIYMNYGGDYLNRRILSTTANVGYGNPLANMSGCNTEAAAGSSTTNGGTGFTPSTTGTCQGNNKDVQEASFGYWYNFYNGPKGRLRQGIQYSYIVRNLWSGAGGTTNVGGSAQGTDNIIETSLRYYLP